MELPSALLILSGVMLVAGVCARVFALYERWVAVMVASLASVVFPGLFLLRRSMKSFVVDQLANSLHDLGSLGHDDHDDRTIGRLLEP